MKWQEKIKEALENQKGAQRTACKIRKMFVEYTELLNNSRDFVGHDWAKEGEDLSLLPEGQEFLDFAMGIAQELKPEYDWFEIEIDVCCNEEHDIDIFKKSS